MTPVAEAFQRRSLDDRAMSRRGFISSILGAISDATSFDKSTSVHENVNFAPSQPVTLFNQSISCGSVGESFKVTVNPSLTAGIDISFAVSENLSVGSNDIDVIAYI